MSVRLTALTRVFVAGLLLWGYASQGVSDQPNKSPERLLNEAKVVVTGSVARIYSVSEKVDGWLDTTYVVELKVSTSEKGRSKAGDLIYARYVMRRTTSPGLVSPGYYGIHTEPEKGQTVRMYLSIASDGGFDVIDPNGVEVLKTP